MEKMSADMFHRLEDRGLARHVPGGGPWWQVESSVADLYMAYLASALSAAHPGTAPVSDTSRAIATLGDPQLSFSDRLNALR